MGDGIRLIGGLGQLLQPKGRRVLHLLLKANGRCSALRMR